MIEETAERWVRRGYGVVPLHPRLMENGRGKLSPVPLIRWQRDGPLRSVDGVRGFWRTYPGAQLALLLEKGLVSIDVDLKKLPGGKAPEKHPVPEGPGYCETTKGGGLHYLFMVREEPDPSRSSRVVQLADYVDVLAGGILVVAPTRFVNAPKGYELLREGLPVFERMDEALGRYSGWLPAAWRRQWERSVPVRSPMGTESREVRSGYPRVMDAGEWAAPLGEVRSAIDVVLGDRDLSRFFRDGFRGPDGAVDRSQTEWRLAEYLRRRGVSREACWAVVRLCPHSKSVTDGRGRGYFETHVWGRLERREASG